MLRNGDIDRAELVRKQATRGLDAAARGAQTARRGAHGAISAVSAPFIVYPAGTPVAISPDDRVRNLARGRDNTGLPVETSSFSHAIHRGAPNFGRKKVAKAKLLKRKPKYIQLPPLDAPEMTPMKSAGFFHRASVAGSWAGTLLLAILSLVPGEWRPHTGYPGHAEHYVAYFLTSIPMALAWPSLRGRARSLAFLSACAGAFEILQNFSPGRGPSFSDWAFSAGGAVCGILVVSLSLAALSPRDLAPT
ncbi:MAG: VanZ family protein [Methylobacteriaceae bacterium]|nr:VanZ family protein [Rhodoblastus sp.]MCC0003664.1 VanZ family protein [Methylobacteriaceae bacterium]